jgi:hypothetical protein
MSIEDTLEAMQEKLDRDVAELARVRSNVQAFHRALEPTPNANEARIGLEVVEILLGESIRHLKTSAALVGEIDVNAEPPSEPETPAEISCGHRLPASLAGSYEEHGSGKIEVPEWAKALK